MSHTAELLVGRHNCWHEMSAEESRASRADHLSRVFAFMMVRRTQYTFPSLKVSLLMIHLLTRPRQCFALCNQSRYVCPFCRPIFVKLDVMEPQAKQNLILIVIQFCVARNSTNGGRNTFCNAPRGVHEDVWSLYFPEMAWMMRILWLCRHLPGGLEESARSVPPNSVLGHLVGHPLLHTPNAHGRWNIL